MFAAPSPTRERAASALRTQAVVVSGTTAWILAMSLALLVPVDAGAIVCRKVTDCLCNWGPPPAVLEGFAVERVDAVTWTFEVAVVHGAGPAPTVGERVSAEIGLHPEPEPLEPLFIFWAEEVQQAHNPLRIVEVEGTRHVECNSAPDGETVPLDLAIEAALSRDCDQILRTRLGWRDGICPIGCEAAPGGSLPFILCAVVSAWLMRRRVKSAR